MNEYTIAEAGSTWKLIEAVNKLLKDGWIVSGSMFYSHDKGVFFQPLVRA